MCASVMPQAPRGRPSARRPTSGIGARNSRTRSATSASAPAISQAPRPMPQAASRLRGVTSPNVARIASAAASAGDHSRRSAAGRSPRFQASSGPAGRTISAGAIRAAKVRLK